MNLSEIFTSIQGEGRYIGVPQVFIRFSGCNLRCVWCDTKYAWNGGREYELSEVLNYLKKTGLHSVCITGGEPMLQLKELKALVKALKSRNCFIVLETNGTIYDEQIFSEVDCVSCDMKPPSSGEKSDMKILESLEGKDQIKVVISDEADYLFAKNLGEPQVQVILQPVQELDPNWLAQKVIQDSLNYRILPQLHKTFKIR